MKRHTNESGQSEEAWEERYRELAATCRLWMAATQARDERVAELEHECNRLRQRVARLMRTAGRPHATPRQAMARQPLRRTPTVL